MIMKKHMLLVCFLLNFLLSLNAQDSVESLVQEGIGYHDNGDYRQALASYAKALELAPNSSLVHYEMALTYMYAKDYEKALEHSEIVISNNDKYMLEAIMTKGSCLDYLGRTRESISLFEKAIKKYGANHLLYYNLGFDYYRLKNFEKSEAAFVNAIGTKITHPSSHLLLAYQMKENREKIKAILGLHFFLLLEPHTPRAKDAYAALMELTAGNVKQTEGKPNQIEIFYNPNSSSSKEFGPAELMISMLQASNTTEENKSKSKEDLFVSNTTSLFKILGELKKKKNKGLWWDTYIPFFAKLADSPHMETYCYHISRSSNDMAVQWLKNNADKTEALNKWLKENGVER
jgi:tetratricopeptide (TPR) repeat protein